MTDDEIKSYIQQQLDQFKRDLPNDDQFVSDVFSNGLQQSDTNSSNPFPSSISGFMSFLMGMFKLKDPAGYFSFLGSIGSGSDSGSGGSGSGSDGSQGGNSDNNIDAI